MNIFNYEENKYLRSSMTEKRLNNCLLLNAHKELTENLDLILIAEEFVEKLDERKRYFGNFLFLFNLLQ